MAREPPEFGGVASTTLILEPRDDADLPIWFGPPGAGPVEGDHLVRLGVSLDLVEDLRTWNERWSDRAALGADPLEYAPGQPLSVRLARHLQAELPAYEVFLSVDGDLRAARELRC